MAVLGLGTIGEKPKSSKKAKSKDNDDKSMSQADEAKALLDKMNAKADADECPFC